MVPVDINDTISQVSGTTALASPKEDSYDEDSLLPPYQQPTEEEGDSAHGLDSILKAKIFTLEGVLKTAELKTRSLESDLRVRNDELMDLHERNTYILKELKEKDEMIEVAKAKEQSYDEIKCNLE